MYVYTKYSCNSMKRKPVRRGKQLRIRASRMLDMYFTWYLMNYTSAYVVSNPADKFIPTACSVGFSIH